jgi:hypothetical protein
MSDAILDKVRKLLAKAEDPACTPAEAEAFTDKAAQLIAKYGVDSALLAARNPGADPIGDRQLDIPAPYAVDKCSLLAGVAAELRCQSVRKQSWSGDRKAYVMHLFGHGSDLDRVELLFTSLLVQASFALAAARVPTWESIAAYRRSWFAGYTKAVVLRLRAAERRAVDEASAGGVSVALVLADRTTEVTQRVADAYPRLGFAGPRRLGGSGAQQGFVAGQRADLGAPSISATSPRAI